MRPTEKLHSSPCFRTVVIYTVVAIVYQVTGLSLHSNSHEIPSDHLQRIFGKNAVHTGNIPEYSIVYPSIQRSSDKNKRDSSEDDVDQYLVEGLPFKDHMMVELKHNNALLRGITVEGRLSDGSIIPLGISVGDCYYIGTLMDDSESMVALSQCNDEMMGFIESGNGSYMIQPVVEGAGPNSPHVIYNFDDWFLHSDLNDQVTYDVTMCYISKELSNGKVTAPSNRYKSVAHYECNEGYTLLGPSSRECLITGDWSGYTPICVANDSVQGIKIVPMAPPCPSLGRVKQGSVSVDYNMSIHLFVAHHTCEDGYVISGDELRFCQGNGQWSGIEPICFQSELLDAYENGPQSSKHIHTKRQTAVPKTVETMVYVDTGVVQFHGQSNIVNYVLSIMNVLSGLYRDPTLEDQIDYAIVRIIVEMAGNELNLPREGPDAISTFCNFQQSINTLDEDDPMHHDHAILITSVNICADDGNGVCSNSVIGISPISGMCTTSRNCNINEDIGLGTAFLIAHENGHSFGMQHDGENNDCSSNSNRIMDAILAGRSGLFQWSTCSAEYLSIFLNNGGGDCLEDTPPASVQPADPALFVGTNFDADAQCRAWLGPNAEFCTSNINQVCSNLICRPTSTGSCRGAGIPAVTGTTCGTNMICVQGSCVSNNTDFTPVNGQWGEFGPVSSCSRSCGLGVRFRERQCDNPVPQFGGNYCVGEPQSHELCNTEPCPIGTPSLRAVQCTATNSVPLGGVEYTWLPFTVQVLVSTVGPCQLVCQAAEDLTLLFVRSNTVLDGTPCLTGSFDDGVCTDGVCTAVGCDGVLNSGMQRDACGICNGGNQTATFVTDSDSQVVEIGYHDLTVIPAGARHVNIADEPFLATFIALLINGEYFLNGNFLLNVTSQFIVADNEYEYFRGSSTGQENIFTTGPLTQPLSVQVASGTTNTYSIRWQYFLCSDPNQPPPDTAFGADPHFTVKLMSNESLCYSVQGIPHHDFNLISQSHLTINARFIPGEPEDGNPDATWIGMLAVIPHTNTSTIIFDSVSQEIIIKGHTSARLKASSVQTITITPSNKLMVKAVHGLKRKNNMLPRVKVVIKRSSARLDVTYHFDHLDVEWSIDDEMMHQSHGLVGQFLTKGIEIDPLKEILIRRSGLEPVPVLRSEGWDFQNGQPIIKCWKAMNVGNQGEGLIEGSVSDYMVQSITDKPLLFDKFKR